MHLTRRLFSTIASLALIAICASSAQVVAADDPLLERVQAVVERWNEAWWGERDTDIDTAAKAAVEGFDHDELRGMHLAILLGHHAMADSSGIAEAARTRLRAFVGADGVDGAAAAVMLFRERVRDTEAVEEKARLYRETLRHPALLEAARLGAARDIFHIGPPRSRELLDLVAEDILSLERLLVPEAAAELSPSYDWFFATLVALADAGFDVDVQAIRRQMVALATEALPLIPEARKRAYMQGVIDHLSGAAARGELLNHPAPEIAFQWSSDSTITSLADLTGKVVVLEFWATWCGPCVAAIPKKRELHEHYAGKPVAIIGATTLDPHFVTADRGVEVVDGNPERAHQLMAEYIAAKDITWPIVYCDDRAKSEFGVRGIPYIALIDAAGIVRHIGLHPAQDEPLREKIDALISEVVQHDQPALPVLHVSEHGSVEFVGLRSMSAEELIAGLPRIGDTDRPHYCAATLKTMGFEDAAVEGVMVDGRLHWVVTVVDPLDADRVQRLPAPSGSAAVPDHWKPLVAHVIQTGPPIAFAIHHFGRTLSADAMDIESAFEKFRTEMESSGMTQNLEPVRETWRLIRSVSSPDDSNSALMILRENASPAHRAAALCVLLNFADDDATWHALARAARDPAPDVHNLTGVALGTLASHAARPVDWSPAADDVRHVLNGTAMFAHQPMIRALLATDVSPDLACVLLKGGSPLLVSILGSHVPVRREQARSLLGRIRGEDLGADPTPWYAWATSCPRGR